MKNPSSAEADPLRVLAIDDNPADLELIQIELDRAGVACDLTRATNRNDAIEALEKRPDIVLTDSSMPGLDALDVLDLTRNIDPHIPVIVVSGSLGEEKATDIVRHGARNFLLKDELERLSVAMQSALARRQRVRTKRDVELAHNRLAPATAAQPELVIRTGPSHLSTVFKGAPEQLRAETQITRQAALIDQANDAIIVYGLNHFIELWNHGAEKLYGWTAAEAIGKSRPDLTGVPSEHFAEAMRLLLITGDWSGEFEQSTKDGRITTVAARWSLVRNDQGQPTAVLAIETNVTERKKIEAQFLRVQRNESIARLAGGIAHDLNNLLAPIVMGVELLRISPLSPADHKVVNTIEDCTKQSTQLVGQVLAYARGVEGSRVSLSVRHLVSEVELIIAATFPKNITLTVNIANDVGLVTGDPSQLNEVLLSLCASARDAMPLGGRLTITAQNQQFDNQDAACHGGVTIGHFVVIELSDTGKCIPKDDIEKIFEPYFASMALGRGTGPDLATALGIVRSHGGFVQVSSEPCRGSIFKIYLPTRGDRTVETTRLVDTDQRPRGNGEWILVVDDDANIRSVTQKTLEAFGYRVILAENGAAALRQFVESQGRIAAVITDLMMPVMDGHALIAAVRRIAPDIPIVATSGLQANAELAEAGIAESCHFIAKPYSAGTLLKKLRALISPKLAGAPS